ncbi:LOW QUALITY PROTEIN: tektin bundle-interacting protein 1 [Ciconia maguari]
MAGLRLSALANERELPPTPSDRYLVLWGLPWAPLLKQAVCWKTTPMGWGAVGQSWSPGQRGRDEEAEDPGTRRCWQWAHAVGGSGIPCPQLCSPPPAYAQHLREVAWDPIVPAVDLGPCTRGGRLLWHERPIPGKEHVITHSQSPRVLLGAPRSRLGSGSSQPPSTCPKE